MLLGKLHHHMNRCMAHDERTIDYDIKAWNTKAAWRRIAKCIGLGLIDALEVDDTTAKR